MQHCVLSNLINASVYAVGMILYKIHGRQQYICCMRTHTVHYWGSHIIGSRPTQIAQSNTMVQRFILCDLIASYLIDTLDWYSMWLNTTLNTHILIWTKQHTSGSYIIPQYKFVKVQTCTGNKNEGHVHIVSNVSIVRQLNEWILFSFPFINHMHLQQPHVQISCTH